MQIYSTSIVLDFILFIITIIIIYFFFFFAVALRPNAGHGLLILDVSRSHTQGSTTVGRTPLDE